MTESFSKGEQELLGIINETLAIINKKLNDIITEQVFQYVTDQSKDKTAKPVDDSAGKITPADLEFGLELDNEYKEYKSRFASGQLVDIAVSPVTTVAVPAIFIPSWQEVGNIGRPPLRTSKPKKLTLWKRLVERFSRARALSKKEPST